ncbi:hypothetical protein FP2506_06886 [Fulvimarina pelagi HTCC2506]|uniref:Uncharacterized protein n=2 Tax=Fulvimarina pelagi TaxID=217511 RepID=Q0G719_9HYPH|nr:hypothetical protein FP2506_06886 [Fulvimarina pelagi HTCC2506]
MNSARLLEQLRPQLEAFEIESGRLQTLLAKIAPEVAENGKALSKQMDAAKSGDLSGELGSKFTQTLAKLNELEQLAEALTANHLALRSIWEQYARAVLQAEALRKGFGSV